MITMQLCQKRDNYDEQLRACTRARATFAITIAQVCVHNCFLLLPLLLSAARTPTGAPR